MACPYSSIRDRRDSLQKQLALFPKSLAVGPSIAVLESSRVARCPLPLNKLDSEAEMMRN